MPYISEAYRAFLDDSQRRQLFADHTSLGYHPDTRDKFFAPLKDRFAGMSMLGKPGKGKSGLLQNMIAQDIQQNQAVIILDPHGDLTVDCIAQLPPEKIAKTYLLDMEDEDYPFGVNVFQTPKNATAVAQAQAIDRVMHSFVVLWNDVLSQLYLPLFL